VHKTLLSSIFLFGDLVLVLGFLRRDVTARSRGGVGEKTLGEIL